MNNTILFPQNREAADIDSTIRTTISNMRISILTIGIGLAYIKINRLHRQLGCKSFAEYLRLLYENVKMDRSSMYRWLNVGMAFLKYQDDLEKTGYIDTDGPTKLSYLERALEKYDKDEVFRNIKTMSVREFAVYARKSPVSSANDIITNPYLSVQAKKIHSKNRLTIRINSKLNRETRTYFRRVIPTLCQALDKGEVILPVLVHNMAEARRFERPVNQFVNKLQKAG